MREVLYLNLKWFMVNFFNRKDRVSMINSLEVRVFFVDIRLVDYVFNLLVEVKLYKGREKGLLRVVFEGILLKEIVYRKKSLYFKIYNLIYIDIVCRMLIDILDKKLLLIYEIIDDKVVKEIVRIRGELYKLFWYG